MKPFTKILVAIDFSPNSDEALAVALDMAGRYDASVTLVHSYQVIDLAFPGGSSVYAGVNLEGVMDELAKELEKRKQSAVAKGASRIDVVLLSGYPPGQISDLASSGGFDLIVMGTHGRTGITRMLTGSVAERVVRTAPCPVLTVRPR
jgi:nucleotide-binding universal stress UspA family protein